MSHDNWFVYRDQKQMGPYTWEQMQGYALDGNIVPHDQVWNSSLNAWTMAGDVDGLFSNSSTHDKPGHIPDTSPKVLNGTPLEDDERVVGYLTSMRRKTGFFKSKMYTFVLTDRRIIFAELTGEMLKDAAKRAADESKAQGKGFFRRTIDVMKSSQRIYDRYHHLSPEDILNENPNNYYIYNDRIEKIKIKRGFSDENGVKTDDKMILFANGEKIVLYRHVIDKKETKKLFNMAGIAI